MFPHLPFYWTYVVVTYESFAVNFGKDCRFNVVYLCSFVRQETESQLSDDQRPVAMVAPSTPPPPDVRFFMSQYLPLFLSIIFSFQKLINNS